MNKLALLAVLLLGIPVIATASQPVDAPTMALSEVKAGMKGQVWTVFRGTEVEAFDVEVTGVVNNALGPGKSMIICELKDPRVQAMGAVAGMSGSPLYVEGKLVGALSYQVQQFETVRYAGFTPVADLDEVRAQVGAPKAVPTSGADASAAIPAPAGFRALQPVFTVTGLSPAVAELFGPRLAALGLGMTSLGGSAGGALGLESQPVALTAGSAVAVALSTGDITLAGTGTVSRVDGDRVTAFGHPMMSLGDVALPMLSAEIVTILPSNMQSVKVANTGRVIGTIAQDRLSAIAGTLGAGPEMVPVEVVLTKRDGSHRTLKFAVARHPQLTPSIVAAGVTEAIMSSNDAGIAAGFRLASSVEFAGRPALNGSRIYSGPQAFAQGLNDFVGGLAGNLQNPYEKSFPEKVRFTVEPLAENPTAVVDGLQLSRTTARAGETVQATVSWHDWQGASHRDTVEIRVSPEWIGRTIDVVLTTGRALDELGGRSRSLNATQLRSFDAYLAALSDDRRNDGLYLAVVEKTAVFTDQAQPNLGLPGSFERIARGSDETRYQKQDGYVSLWERHMLPGRLATAQTTRSLTVVE